MDDTFLERMVPLEEWVLLGFTSFISSNVEHVEPEKKLFDVEEKLL